ncbi:hypothetical protein KIPB_008158, partial [Kipferlia bialata]|eukprot:g8158.t1
MSIRRSRGRSALGPSSEDLDESSVLTDEIVFGFERRIPDGFSTTSIDAHFQSQFREAQSAFLRAGEAALVGAPLGTEGSGSDEDSVSVPQSEIPAAYASAYKAEGAKGKGFGVLPSLSLHAGSPSRAALNTTPFQVGVARFQRAVSEPEETSGTLRLSPDPTPSRYTHLGQGEGKTSAETDSAWESVRGDSISPQRRVPVSLVDESLPETGVEDSVAMDPFLPSGIEGAEAEGGFEVVQQRGVSETEAEETGIPSRYLVDMEEFAMGGIERDTQGEEEGEDGSGVEQSSDSTSDSSDSSTPSPVAIQQQPHAASDPRAIRRPFPGCEVTVPQEIEADNTDSTDKDAEAEAVVDGDAEVESSGSDDAFTLPESQSQPPTIDQLPTGRLPPHLARGAGAASECEGTVEDSVLSHETHGDVDADGEATAESGFSFQVVVTAEEAALSPSPFPDPEESAIPSAYMAMPDTDATEAEAEEGVDKTPPRLRPVGRVASHAGSPARPSQPLPVGALPHMGHSPSRHQRPRSVSNPGRGGRGGVMNSAANMHGLGMGGGSPGVERETSHPGARGMGLGYLGGGRPSGLRFTPRPSPMSIEALGGLMDEATAALHSAASTLLMLQAELERTYLGDEFPTRLGDLLTQAVTDMSCMRRYPSVVYQYRRTWQGIHEQALLCVDACVANAVSVPQGVLARLTPQQQGMLSTFNTVLTTVLLRGHALVGTCQTALTALEHLTTYLQSEMQTFQVLEARVGLMLTD